MLQIIIAMGTRTSNKFVRSWVGKTNFSWSPFSARYHKFGLHFTSARRTEGETKILDRFTCVVCVVWRLQSCGCFLLYVTQCFCLVLLDCGNQHIRTDVESQVVSTFPPPHPTWHLQMSQEGKTWDGTSSYEAWVLFKDFCRFSMLCNIDLNSSTFRLKNLPFSLAQKENWNGNPARGEINTRFAY